MRFGNAGLVFILTAFFCGNTFVSVSSAGVDPTSATWTLYKVYLYASGGCTGTPETVLNVPAGDVQNFVANPTLANATIADGTYNCIAIKMSDQVSFVPSANEGTSCVAGTTYNLSVCPSTYSTTDADTSTTTACTSGADVAWIYISTWSTSASNDPTSNPFKPPTSNGDATNGINLGSALTVSGTITNTFVIDTSAKVATTQTGPGGSDECGMEEPVFTFE